MKNDFVAESCDRVKSWHISGNFVACKTAVEREIQLGWCVKELEMWSAHCLCSEVCVVLRERPWKEEI